MPNRSCPTLQQTHRGSRTNLEGLQKRQPKHHHCNTPSRGKQSPKEQHTSHHLEVNQSTENPSRIVQLTRKQAKEPGTAKKLAAEGSQVEQSARNDRQLTSQEVIVTEEPTEPEPPEKVSTKDTRVALCVKTKLEAEIAQATATDRVGNVESEPTGAFAPEVHFEEPLTEVALFAMSTYQIWAGIGVTKSALYSRMCLVDTGACPNLISKPYLRLYWTSCFKSLDVPMLWAATKELIIVQGNIALV